MEKIYETDNSRMRIQTVWETSLCVPKQLSNVLKVCISVLYLYT